jgi:hypothetical protein
MALGGVIRHEVEDHLEAAAMRRRDQIVECRQIAEQWVDVAVIRDVVAEIRHRRWEDRRDPHRVDAEKDEMIEAPGNAGEIADAVAVAVLKRARVDLIDDPALPPARIGHRALASLGFTTAR